MAGAYDRETAPVAKTTATSNTGKYLGKDGKYYNSPVEAALARDIGSSVNYQANISDQVAEAQAKARKPVMSQAQIEGGGQIKWVGSVDGNWQIIMPIGSPLVGSKAAGWEAGTATTTATTVTKTADQTAAYNDAKALAQEFVSLYGGTLADYFDAATGKVKQPSADVINKKLSGAGGKTEVSRVDNGDGTFTVTYSDKSTAIIGTKNNSNIRPVGTPPAYIFNSATGKWEQPAKPTDTGNWVWDNNNGWVNTLVNPGSSGFSTGSDKTLAIDTFRNTIGLLFGAKEASQPWVTALYTSASKFYNTGSTIDEAINLSLQDVRGNAALKPFTDRFKGIYALTDRLAKGEAIEVPTVAEYFKSESAMGDVLRAAGMGDLATQDFLGDVIGRGKSVLEVTNLITDTFDRIDNAPSALKADLQAYFPGADRTSIAKAMLTGEKGAAELTKKVKSISVQSAAKTQGVTISDLTSEDIAGQGYDYNQSLANFATVKQLERGGVLGRMSGIDLTQQEAIASTFQSNAAAAEKIRKIKEEELNRFGGSAGKLASRSRAQGAI